MTIPERIKESQQNHDAEVCRLAKKYSALSIWSSCPEVQSRVEVPQFSYANENYEPDVFLSQVPPKGETKPVDWVFEIETSESVSTDHTRYQLSSFAEYAKKKEARVIVLVPPQDVEQMKVSLKKWELVTIVVQPWGWPD